MGAYTSTQLMVRLAALGFGLLGGLCQVIWSQVVGMGCGATELGSYVFHLKCPPWTELFLKFPDDISPEMVSVVLAAAIVGFLASAAVLWRPRWGALMFVTLSIANLAMVVGAIASVDQDGLSSGLGILAIVVPLACALVAWRWGEYRVRRAVPQQPSG